MKSSWGSLLGKGEIFQVGGMIKFLAGGGWGDSPIPPVGKTLGVSLEEGFKLMIVTLSNSKFKLSFS